MGDGVSNAERRRNLLERIAARIPGLHGYLEREMRREVDKMERDWMAEQVDRARRALADAVADWSSEGGLEALNLAGRSDKRLDRLANRIRHADYGYTGYFDAVKVYENELDRLYEFDLDLMDDVEGLRQRAETLPSLASSAALRSMLEAIEELDRRFDERARVFEDVTQKGAGDREGVER